MFEEKVIKLNYSTSVSYLDNHNFGKKNILFVHGWAADKYNLKGIYSFLDSAYRIIALDLPGFGKSSIPAASWGSEEYSKLIKDFLTEIGISKICYIGHSFGGKIGLFFTSSYPEFVERLVLIDSAGLRNKRSFSWYIKVYFYKLLKFIFIKILKSASLTDKLKNHFGSTDYKNAGLMRSVLVKSTNEDFTGLLSRINCPVFLYWGEKDKDTPLWMAYKMKKLIKDSALYVVKNGSHFSFLEDDRIIDIIRSFY